MRYGHSVNSSIPADPNEAEFPPQPWPNDVTIRIKSHPSPQASLSPLTVDGAAAWSRQNPPPSWQGPALGQAPQISADASGLVGSTSPQSARTVEGQIEDPPEENLQEFRGLSKKDELIHSMISWATLESYSLRIGVSLPIVNPVQVDGEEVFHEAQLWEETEERWTIEKDHADFVYSWLSNRFSARFATRTLPVGMPESVGAMSVQTKKDG
jgi:hypothetical protein